jgi:thiamine thiazole synthase
MAAGFDEAKVSRVLVAAYQAKLAGCIESDVLIAGAGPSGMLAAGDLAAAGLNVVVVEKRLAPGGGVWGGGMAMNEVVLQPEVTPVVEELGLKTARGSEGMTVADAGELACALYVRAVGAGATCLNLSTVEDVCIRQQVVEGLVVNRSMISEALPVDPLLFTARATIDGTGHDAVVVNAVQRQGVKLETPTGRIVGQGPMHVVEGERFVVEHTGRVCPGLYVSGMAVCVVFGGPRMGPIFGGMLMSGRKVAQLIAAELKQSGRG